MKSIVCIVVLATAPVSARDETYTYTNEDLERVAPYRDQMGAWTVDGPGPGAGKAPTPDRQATAQEATERRWRREARRLQERLAPRKKRADELRQRIEERRHATGAPWKDPQRERLESELEAVEFLIRQAEDAFEERARKAGALPGWIR
ncbi:MAG: hypothetical protein HY317_02055 [Acidobacteria bacterium]|nr:hypothetical protein [Acidobacteriota bacterium]